MTTYRSLDTKNGIIPYGKAVDLMEIQREALADVLLHESLPQKLNSIKIGLGLASTKWPTL